MSRVALTWKALCLQRKHRYMHIKSDSHVLEGIPIVDMRFKVVALFLMGTRPVISRSRDTIWARAEKKFECHIR